MNAAKPLSRPRQQLAAMIGDDDAFAAAQTLKSSFIHNSHNASTHNTLGTD